MTKVRKSNDGATTKRETGWVRKIEENDSRRETEMMEQRMYDGRVKEKRNGTLRKPLGNSRRILNAVEYST